MNTRLILALLCLVSSWLGSAAAVVAGEDSPLTLWTGSGVMADSLGNRAMDASANLLAGGEIALALRVAEDDAKTPLLLETEEARRWRLRLHYFVGTENSLGSIFVDELKPISQDGIGLTLGRVVAQDFKNLPLNLLFQGGVLWHDENGAQDNFLQYTIAFKAEWTRFPWSNHLQTRLGLASGFSYANPIPTTEVRNRGGKSSKHLLHYLEPSLALNCGDLTRLTRISNLLRFDSQKLEHFWLVGSIPHRSGMWGVYGDDDEGQPIRGGSNYLSIGIEAEF